MEKPYQRKDGDPDPGIPPRETVLAVKPMSGEEVFAMFGDRSVLEMEQRQAVMEEALNRLAAQLQEETDPDEVQLLKEKLSEQRDQMRDLDRLIRRERRRHGENRGPVSL